MNGTKVNTEIGDVSSPETKKARPKRYWYRPEVGPQPPYKIISDNVGLGGDRKYVRYQVPSGALYDCDLEHILRVIDWVQEPGRTSLLCGAEIEYGLPLGAMMGPELHSANEGGSR